MKKKRAYTSQALPGGDTHLCANPHKTKVLTSKQARDLIAAAKNAPRTCGVLIDWSPELQKIYRWNPTPPIESGYIYLVRGSDGLYKIGITKGIEGRIRELAKTFPQHAPMQLIHHYFKSNARREEERLHKRYSDKRVHHEWFSLSREDVDYIISLKGVRR